MSWGKMNKKLLIFTTGFALFSMFFGSGNLVFPITVGQESGGHFVLAALGILLTGVIVPLLGVLGMMLHKGSIKSFFSSFGKVGTFIFCFASLALMGPFGVLARCFTVAHGAVETIFPTAPLVLTSLAFCFCIYVMSIKKSTIIPTLGSILTPLLLLAIGAIAVFAYTDFSVATTPVVSTTTELTSGWVAFKSGFFQGYQTMDLLAAFFFSVFVINHLASVKKEGASEKSHLKIFLQSAALGGGVLGAVYFLLVGLGSTYSTSLAGVLPQEMLGHIAMQTLGSVATPCLCVLVILACFTTAIVLASLFADFLQKEVFRDKIGSHLSLIITLGIGFAVSTQGFMGIARFLGPLLDVIYPALISLTLVNIAHHFFGVRRSHWPVTLTFIARLCFTI